MSAIWMQAHSRGFKRLAKDIEEYFEPGARSIATTPNVGDQSIVMDSQDTIALSDSAPLPIR